VRLILCCALTLLACGDDDSGGGSGDDAGGIIDAGGPRADAAESGRACATGLDAEDPTALATPALDCPTRVCLHVEGRPPDLCTSSCEDTADCFSGPETACAGDFACVAPVDVGPFACRKFCVCDSAVPEGGFPVDCP
jgi:hypothetical protein